MILGVSILLFGASLLYAGLHKQTVTDLLQGKQGVPPGQTLLPDGTLVATSGGSVVAGGTGAGSVPGATGQPVGSKLTPHGTIQGHPELLPAVSAVVATILHQFPNLVITSTYRPGGASYHAQHRACDLAGSNMDAIGTWISQNLAGSLVEGIHNPTLSIKNGISAPPSFWGDVTWAAHRNHIHVAA